MSDPYYQQNNPYQYDQPAQSSGQYPQQSGPYPPSGAYQQPSGAYQQPAGAYPPPSMPLQQAYQQPVYVQTPVIITTQSTETSGWAIASFVCSILGISLLGVIFGHVALSGINKSNGQLGGKGLAIAGLILGYIPLAFEVFFLCFIVIAAMSAASSGGATWVAPIFG